MVKRCLWAPLSAAPSLFLDRTESERFLDRVGIMVSEDALDLDRSDMRGRGQSGHSGAAL